MPRRFPEEEKNDAMNLLHLRGRHLEGDKGKVSVLTGSRRNKKEEDISITLERGTEGTSSSARPFIEEPGEEKNILQKTQGEEGEQEGGGGDDYRTGIMRTEDESAPTQDLNCFAEIRGRRENTSMAKGASATIEEGIP